MNAPTDLPPPFLDLEEGLYNARDVLGMCRAYQALGDALVRTGALDVYSVDRQMAFLAQQMTRTGMPIDIAARDALGDKLRVARDEAAEKLRQFTVENNYESFVEWIALYQAAKIRKSDPQAGQMNDVTGTVHSAESAFLLRKAARKAEFAAGLAKSAWKQDVYDHVKASTGPVTNWSIAEEMTDTLDETATEEDRSAWQSAFKQIAAQVGNLFRSWGTQGILAIEKTIEGKGKDKRTVYTATLAPPPEDEEEHEEWQEALAESIGGINFGAKIQQAAILRVAGVPLTKLTPKTGLPKVGKETLEELAFHEPARWMLDWILTAAAISNVIEGYIVGPDGCVHPEWLIHKITGRWGSHPNVQNLSKRAGGGRVNMRTMFVAPPGLIFVGADFAQLEARIIAAASQDPFLLEVFRTGQDIHGALAGVAFPEVWPKLAELYGTHKGQACGPNPVDHKSKCDFCKQRDKLRDLTKRLEYGAFYGGMAETLWKSVVKDFPDLKIQQIHEFLRTVGQRMPGVLRWRAETLAKAEKECEIRSPILGRREVFPLGRVEPTVAYNYIPQSGGADLWALGAIDFMARWDQFGSEDARICHNGHDSILILCKEQYAEQVQRDVVECWTRQWNGVTFSIEAEIGRKWSDT